MFLLSDILNKHSLNINHLDDSIFSNPTNIDDLKTENTYIGLENSIKIVGCTNVKKKCTEQKVVGNVHSYGNKLLLLLLIILFYLLQFTYCTSMRVIINYKL